VTPAIHQLETNHVISETAFAVVVLAMHIGGDGATHGHVAGAWGDGQKEASGHHSPQQSIEADACASGDPGMGGIRADLIEGRQIEHGAPFALGRIPISPAEAAADQAGGGSGLDQRLDLL
jgi:hypothetical protein